MRKITDKKELMKLCSFIVMSDGGVYPKGKNHYFAMNMKASNVDYINYCKDILENITTTRISERVDYNTDGYNREEQLRLESRTHPFFNALRDRIYFGTYKSIDQHALKLMDWECLAILYMSDGCLSKDFRPSIGMKKCSYNVTLNMKRLSYGDQLLLKKRMKEVFDLEWNINKNGKYYCLRLRSKDVEKFFKGVAPYILPSFSYKIVNDCLLTGKAEADDIV